MKAGRKPEYLEKTPGDELQKEIGTYDRPLLRMVIPVLDLSSDIRTLSEIFPYSCSVVHHL